MKWRIMCLAPMRCEWREPNERIPLPPNDPHSVPQAFIDALREVVIDIPGNDPPTDEQVRAACAELGQRRPWCGATPTA